MNCTDSNQNLTVMDENGKTAAYGGNQAWFESNTRAYAGCSSVAAANVYLALTKQFPISKQDYVKVMNQIYDKMGAFEVPLLRCIYDCCKRDNRFFRKVPPNLGRSIYGFVKGLLLYAKANQVFLSAHVCPTAFLSYERGLAFIEEGLAGGTVVLLTSYNRHALTLFRGETGAEAQPYSVKQGMRCHFVTITGLVKRSTSNGICCADEKSLLISTWGRLGEIPYEDLYRSWQSRRALDSALFYFTVSEDSAVIPAGIKNARGALLIAFRKTIFKK